MIKAIFSIIISLTACLLFAFQIHAQTSYVDSLYTIWSDSSNSAENRVEAFYKRFDPLEVNPKDPELIRWGLDINKVQILAKQIGKTEYEGRFLYLEGGKYVFLTNEPQKAIPLFRLALDKSLEVDDYVTVGSVISGMEQLGLEMEEVIQRLEQYLKNENDHNNIIKTHQIAITRRLARLYYSDSQLLKALELNQQVVVDCEQNNLKNKYYYFAIGLIGGIHTLIGNYDEAEYYNRVCLEYTRRTGTPSDLAHEFVDLAREYTYRGDLINARNYLDSALLITDCYECVYYKAIRVLGKTYNVERKFNRALQELLSIKDYYDNPNILGNFNNGHYYSELAIAYLGLNQYQKAISSAKEGIIKSDDNLYGSLESYNVLYQAYRALGNHRLSLEYFKKYIAAKDARTELRNSQNVTKQELAFQYEQQRLQDSLQLVQSNLQKELSFQKEISRQKSVRNLMLVLGVLALLFALGAYSRYRFVQKTKVELEEKNKTIEAEKEKAQASEHAKHQFLANMSHEIRTPMNAIKGMTDILLRREPQSEQLTYLNAIKESSNSLLVIINDILDISKIEAGKIDLEMIPFSIEEVIQNVILISQFKAEEKGLELQINLNKASPSLVQGDPTRLRQILLNLVGNAIKFTVKGVISIQLKTEEVEGKIDAQFCVSDTGVGIGEDRLEKIFDSFEQAYSDTTRKFGGTGLGLSISKKLVEIQKGNIWAESKKGKGSQFYFTIPYLIAEQSLDHEESIEQGSQAVTSLDGVKILLVEDNTFNAIVAQEELEDAINNVVVEVAENGIIAVEKISHGDFDIILMDIQMPVMNGFEATNIIRNLSNDKSNIPIIAMTANVLKEEVDKCYEAGMNGFIGKPFDTTDLFNKMYNLLNKDL